MNIGLRNNRDAIAGLLFIVIGVLALILARDYPVGVTARMGPGYFPMVLGGILTLFGIYILARGVRAGEPVQGRWAWKPLALITLSILLFGFLMERFGIVPALSSFATYMVEKKLARDPSRFGKGAIEGVAAPEAANNAAAQPRIHDRDRSGAGGHARPRGAGEAGMTLAPVCRG